MSTLRFAFRSLLKSPGFTLIALLTLAIGIGVNTSMFTLVDAILFRPPPYPDADRIVRIFGTSPNSQFEGFSYAELEDLRAHSHSFEALTSALSSPETLSEPGRAAEHVAAVNASEQLFQTVGLQPFLGRGFTHEEQAAGHDNVVILSHAFWQKRFGGNPAIVGRTIRISSQPVTVIGIAPPAFGYRPMWGEVNVWRPLAAPDKFIQNREDRYFTATARLKPGVTVEQATAELAPLAARWAKDYPQISAGRGIRLITLQASTVSNEDRFYSWLVFGLSGFVLLIACLNLANLQLARAMSDVKSLAVRAALGASRARLMANQLAECVLLSSIGGGLGLLAAVWINAVLNSRFGTPDELALNLNGRVFAVTLLASLTAGVFFGLLPAWFASRIDVISALKYQTRTSTGTRSQNRLRHAFIVAQVALSLTLLGGAGVMIRGLNTFFQRPVGWSTDRVITAVITLPEQPGSRYVTGKERVLAAGKILNQLARLPGAESVAICNGMPMFGFPAANPVQTDGQTVDDPSHLPVASYLVIAGDFFKTMGIPLLEGRGFDPNLTGDSPLQVVVGATLAHQLWPDASAIGKRLGVFKDGKTTWQEVIGVVGDIQFPANPNPVSVSLQFYKAHAQEPWGSVHPLVRSERPAALTNELRQVMTQVDADVAVQDVYTVSDGVHRFLRGLFTLGDVLGAIALLGLVLAAIGLFGVISHLVAQRTSEFGIRLALGAQAAGVHRLVLGQGLKLALIGITIGFLGAGTLNWGFKHFLPRAVNADPLTLTGMAVVLFLVALLATYLPARRATKIDPLVALRAE